MAGRYEDQRFIIYFWIYNLIFVVYNLHTFFKFLLLNVSTFHDISHANYKVYIILFSIIDWLARW